jgi:hypothetical protein
VAEIAAWVAFIIFSILAVGGLATAFIILFIKYHR